MVKRAGGALLQSISIDPESDRPLGSQIATAIRDIILGGGLRAGDRLPSTRTLAAELGVSRTTLVEVFERLVAEGLVVSRTGAGTFVSPAIAAKRSLSPALAGNRARGGRDSPGAKRGRWISSQPVFTERLPHSVRAFTTALPAFDEFPMALWSRQTAKHWREQRDVILGYGETAGYPPLRRAIAAHLQANRGIACDEQQIFVVNGAQAAFNVIATMLLERGDTVWFENPGAIGARNALSAASTRLVPIPVDREGILVAQGLDRAPRFRLAFVTPTHQQPLGITMSLERRFSLLDAAERSDAWIIEDDYDGEFYYGRHPLPTLKSIDRAGRVFYVGTFSKTLFPALRLGYFIAPASLVERFNEAFYAYFPGVPSNLQAVVANFMDEGHFAAHVRRMRRIYRQRYETFRECSQRRLAGLLDVESTDSGLHAVGYLRADLAEGEVAVRAEHRGVTVTPIGRFCVAPVGLNGLVLGFSGIKAARIRAGVETLEAVLEAMASDRRPKGPGERALVSG